MVIKHPSSGVAKQETKTKGAKTVRWFDKVQRFFFPERENASDEDYADNEKVAVLPGRLDKSSGKSGAEEGTSKSLSEWGNIVILEPTTYEDGGTIGEAMRSNRTLIINLSNMASKNDATRLLDFICGVAFALDGNINKVSENEPIWLFTNKHVRITKADDRFPEKRLAIES